MGRAFTDAPDAHLGASDADAFLSNASELLASSIDYHGTFARVASLAVPFLADWCAIDVVDPATKAFQRVAVSHVEPEKATLGFEIQRRFPADADLDTGYPKVLRTGISLFVREVPEANLALAAQSPEHLVLLRKLGFHSYMCTPLIARGRTLGTMSFVSSSARRFTPDDLAVAEELSRRAALALDNARLLHRAERARRKAAILAEASRLLASARDVGASFGAVAALAVPELGDLCTIELIAGDGMRQLGALAHVDPDLRPWVREIIDGYPRPPNQDVGLEKVLHSGKLEIYRDIDDSRLRSIANSPEQLERLRALAPKSALVVPIRIREEVLGAIAFTACRVAVEFDASDVTFAEDFADRVALALDNTRLFREKEEARRRAAMLADASRMLASSADPVAILPELLQLAIPDFGDHAAVRLLDASGRFAPAVIANADPLMLEVATVVNERWGAATDEWMMTIVRSGESVFLPVIGDERLRAHATSEEHFAMMKKAAPRSLIVVPIKLREAVFGTLNFSLQRPERNYGSADVALIEDLGHRIALALDNARLHASEQQAIRGRDELLSVASHEMRTPLGALQLMVRVLKNELDAGKPAKSVARDLAAKIELADRQVSRISKIVNKLLDLSRLKAGAVFLDSEDVDLGEVAREVVARFEPETAEAGSSITLAAEPGVVGHWDLFRIEQILTNLIANAIRYGAGHPIDLVIARAGAAARLVVRDRGPGIAPEDLERIFERYARRMQKSFSGLGLGLYIVRQILDEAGGTITVESEPGEGATFIVTIPLRPPPPR